MELKKKSSEATIILFWSNGRSLTTLLRLAMIVTASNQIPNVATTIRNDEASIIELSHTMEQVWETFLKINTFINKLQKAYTAS
ncbi:hypothetical protein DVH24_001981 [Malus domestica]|uniref:Uncharacterized protein n=1 Tax=Malus domestica TaxID=3750 RepID=A0A498IBG5_MALDO|nr:hypothetical protein DVH24_001981 [Malus domestica]